MNVRSYVLEVYRGAHKAPTSSNGSPLHDVTGAYPDDIYDDPSAARIYGHGQDRWADQKSIDIIREARGNPNLKVEIFRAVPSGLAVEIERGDWVTINRDYAVLHGEGPLYGNHKILTKVVRAKDIFTNGDSIHEWGYDP